MEQARRELLVARVVSGVVRLRVHNEFGREVVVVVRNPSREQRYFAQEVYQETLEESRLDGAYTEESLLDFLLEQGQWDDAREAMLRQVEKDIEEFKTKLLGLTFRTYEKKKARLALAAAKEKQRELLGQRHSYDHLTAEGAAAMARARYLVACSLCDARGRPILPEDALWGNPAAERCSVVLENSFEAYLASRLDDAEFRELARTEPWTTLWSARGAAASVFGVAAADLTDEQVRLQVWSQLYENIAGHPEAPPQEVLEDDDLCDGWLILQRRERDKRQKEVKADEVGSERVRGSEEVFIVADTAEDARRIYEMNDDGSRTVLRQREAQIQKKGAVQHADLADVRAYCQMEATRLRAESMKGG